MVVNCANLNIRVTALEETVQRINALEQRTDALESTTTDISTNVEGLATSLDEWIKAMPQEVLKREYPYLTEPTTPEVWKSFLCDLANVDLSGLYSNPNTGFHVEK